jgi:hypothetical protein
MGSENKWTGNQNTNDSGYGLDPPSRMRRSALNLDRPVTASLPLRAQKEIFRNQARASNDKDSAFGDTALKAHLSGWVLKSARGSTNCLSERVGATAAVDQITAGAK